MNIRVENNNLLDYSDWVNNITGSTLMFNNNGGTFSKNYIEMDIDPFNNNNYVWNSTIQSGATAHSSAGWNTDNIIIEPGVNYRYSQWVKRKNNSISRVYFGCAAYGSDNNPRYLKRAKTGVIDTGYGGPIYNANFTSSNWLPNEQWVLINYTILNSGSTTGSTLYNTGIWNSGGTKTSAIFNDMIVTSGTTQIQLRYYGPYVTTTGATHFQASYPRLDILDGTEPSIATLLSNEGMWRSGTTYIKVEDNNLLDYSDWSTDLSGNTKDFTASPGFNEMLNQYREQRLDPFNNTNYIWIASGITTTGATYGGGYVTQKKPIDNTKIYRISQWCNRVNSGDTNNDYYLGFYTYDINNTLTGATRSDGAYSTNYYVYQNISANLSNINGWFLTVGYILPYTMTGNTAAYQGKIYYNSGSTHTSNAYNYRFNINAKYLASRSYSPYNSTSFASSHFAYPRIDLCDGTEPSIATLLSNEGMWRSGTTMIYVDDVWKNT